MAFTISLNGLKNAQTELDVISNNLANAETTGFKKSRVNFSDLVAGSAYTNPKLVQGIGSMVKSIDQNFTSGPMMSTGAALDMAINGEGFYTLENPLTGEKMFTRNGSFSTDSDGYIVDPNNNRLQLLAYDSTSDTYAATPSSIQLTADNASGGKYAGVQIKTDGAIVVSYDDSTTATIGKVALASFASPSGLLQTGNQNWKATGLSGMATFNQPTTGGMGQILSGELEGSNVDMATEMVNLITAQRYFQSNAKAIDTSTAISDAVINLRS
jgi:flagellar hook protein FlgE